MFVFLPATGTIIRMCGSEHLQACIVLNTIIPSRGVCTRYMHTYILVHTIFRIRVIQVRIFFFRPLEVPEKQQRHSFPYYHGATILLQLISGLSVGAG